MFAVPSNLIYLMSAYIWYSPESIVKFERIDKEFVNKREIKVTGLKHACKDNLAQFASDV